MRWTVLIAISGRIVTGLSKKSRNVASFGGCSASSLRSKEHYNFVVHRLVLQNHLFLYYFYAYSRAVVAPLKDICLRSFPTFVDCRPPIDRRAEMGGSVSNGADGILSTGDIITYEVTITNTGTTCLYQIALTDTLSTSCQPPYKGTPPSRCRFKYCLSIGKMPWDPLANAV